MPAPSRRLTIRSAGPLLRALSTSGAGEAAVAALALIVLAAALADTPKWLVFTLLCCPWPQRSPLAGNAGGCRSSSAVSSPLVPMCCPAADCAGRGGGPQR
jgi:hypothetical protein